MEETTDTPSVRLKTGLIYDPVMAKHSNEMNPSHPETAERVTATWHALEAKGLVKQCEVLESREASDEEVLKVHSEEHLSVMASTAHLPQEQLNMLSTCYNSIFINPFTYTASRFAAGCVTELTEGVVSGRVRNGMAVVRPPGHHSEYTKCMGFCHFNNVAIATEHALNHLGLQRVLIVDWDIHHGNGTQHHFYKDNRVLFFSLHRYDHGLFFPCADDANYDYVGEGVGKGFNFNVAWNGNAKGDVDYLLAFYHLLMPVALEFNPELVIVSCGFDAGMGDHLGGYHVSPAGFAHMTHLLMSLAKGKLVLALEGGYSLSCIQESTSAIVSVLLGNAPVSDLDLYTPTDSAMQSIVDSGKAHSEYWKSLQVFGSSESADVISSEKVATSSTPESGNISQAQLHGRGKPSRDLKETIEGIKAAATSQGQDLAQGSPDKGGEKEGQQDEPSDVKSHDSTAGSHDPVAMSHDSVATSSGQEGCSASASAGVETRAPPMTETQQKIIQALEVEGHSTMYAVNPLTWCPHLEAHVEPLPPAGVDSAHTCEVCGSDQEVWVCLACYHAFCGRYVNEHMVAHEEGTGHKIALSLADLSVWCYACDNYLDNHLLRPAINSAHSSKFGTNIDGTTS